MKVPLESTGIKVYNYGVSSTSVTVLKKEGIGNGKPSAQGGKSSISYSGCNKRAILGETGATIQHRNDAGL